MSSLEAQLGEAKAPSKGKCGEDGDEENPRDEDGMLWVKTVGTGVTKFCPSQAAETKPAPAGGRFRTLGRAHHMMLEKQYAPQAPSQMSSLGTQLDSAKALHRGKYGENAEKLFRSSS